MNGARLLKRVFDIDLERCPNCGGEDLGHEVAVAGDSSLRSKWRALSLDDVVRLDGQRRR